MRGPHLKPEVIYEDEQVLVIAKPAGLLSASPSPGDAFTPSAFLFAKQHVKYNAKRGRSRPRVWIIHRLDREASGLMVFAKSETAFEHLKEELQTRRMHRTYEALVIGTFEDDRHEQGRSAEPLAGTMRSLLLERSDRSMETVSPDSREAGDAREAITHYRVEASRHGYSLLKIRLETGRKHQIRVQLAASGHPVAGDRVYGGDEAHDPCSRLALHACELGFVHPQTGKPMRFRHAPPRCFGRTVGLKVPDGDGHPAPSQDDAAPAEDTPPDSTSWDHVAKWYDTLVDQRGSDHHTRVIVPGTVRMLAPAQGERVLDIACGQGVLAGALLDRGASVVGMDLSPKLIDAAHSHLQRAGEQAQFVVMDAREIDEGIDRLGGAGSFDAAALVMAAMNIDPIAPVFTGARRAIKSGGRFVIVMLHPAFRAPQQSGWHWEEDDAGEERCHRTVSGYLSEHRSSIVMNPGQAARGRRAVTTWSFHRPIQYYIKALAKAGFAVDGLEEWTSLRASEPGRRAREENRARREIPMFLAVRALAVGVDPAPDSEV